MARKTKLGLTKSQKELLDFIRAYAAKNGYAPSYDEMKDALGLNSKSGIHRMVHALAERGHIALSANRARSIEIISGDDLGAGLSDETRRKIRAVAGFLKTTPGALIERAFTQYVAGGLA